MGFTSAEKSSRGLNCFRVEGSGLRVNSGFGFRFLG